MVTDLVFHEMFLKHVISHGHPERPERVQRSLETIREAGLLEREVRLLTPTLPDTRPLLRIHGKDYLQSLERMSKMGGGYFTPDTAGNPYTYEAALLAASGGIEAVKRIRQDASNNAYVMCRPPGHHAERSRALGFCFINNIAVAAQYLVDELDTKRVMIVDYDAHHGNGTQNAFYDTEQVLYVGLHQDGRTLFPGTGYPDEIGEGKGRGYNVNLPLHPGAGDRDYELLFERVIEPIGEVYKPEFVLVSAGFDCHFDDPLTNLGLSLRGIAAMNRRITRLAKSHSRGRVAFFLEGGYNLDVMARASLNLVEELTGRDVTDYDEGHVKTSGRIEETDRLADYVERKLHDWFFD
ncbi:MAG: histone deacetylase [Candidatus Thorarchaeota archaeon]